MLVTKVTWPVCLKAWWFPAAGPILSTWVSSGMPLQFNPYVLVLGVTAAIALLLTGMTWHSAPPSSLKRPFLGLLLSVSLYATVAALEAASISLKDKIFWSTLEYVGSGSVAAFFVMFLLHFAHRDRWLTRRHLTGLWAIPAANFLLVATNAWHHWVWTGFTPDPRGGPFITYEHGPGFYWIVGCLYGYTAIGILIALQATLETADLFRQQTKLILLGAIIPLFGSVVYILGLTPPGLNLSPMSFLATGITYFVSFFSTRLLDFIPVAQHTLLENMSDGVVVIDRRHRLINLNPAAQEFLGIHSRYFGLPANQILAPWTDLLTLCHSRESSKTEIMIEQPVRRFVELRVSPLYNRYHWLTGHLIVLHDVTEQRETEAKLRQLNQKLQRQLLSIQNLQVQLRLQAIRDKLTGLLNRRYFDEAFPKVLEKADREGYPVAVILLDLDHFKLINDTHGHLAGDRVLQAFSELLQSFNRSSDIVCRYGGEEFVLALPGMSMRLACQRAEQIRRSFQALVIEFQGQQLRTTLSAGVGVFPVHGQTQEDLLRRVDRALYAAKDKGRNCIKRVRRVRPQSCDLPSEDPPSPPSITLL